ERVDAEADELARDPKQPVAVRVRLDDAHDLGAADPLLDRVDVASERWKRDVRGRRTKRDLLVFEGLAVRFVSIAHRISETRLRSLVIPKRGPSGMIAGPARKAL